jgi:hypothetical protein
MIETVHVWTDNPIYCYKLGKVVIADNTHLQNECTNCPYFSGSAQGQGVENTYYDGSNVALVQNPDPNDLQERMRKIPANIVLQLLNTRAERAKASRLATAINTINGKQKYKILRDNAYVGRVTFAPDIAIDLNSQDVALINQVQDMMVNPVDGATIGTSTYPSAVLSKLNELGYTVRALN